MRLDIVKFESSWVPLRICILPEHGIDFYFRRMLMPSACLRRKDLSMLLKLWHDRAPIMSLSQVLVVSQKIYAGIPSFSMLLRICRISSKNGQYPLTQSLVSGLELFIIST